jgi:predicted short-subunit dehydrogenase-like oxidoreductase (DUF2520 family)
MKVQVPGNMGRNSNIRTITMIGAGNVSWHFSRALHNKGYIIREIWSRKLQHAQELASKSGSKAVSSISSISLDSDLYILAVNDSAISTVVKELIPNNSILVHTAGSVDMQAIAGVSPNYGVLYPLQTFSKHIPLNLAEVPFCIEASNSSTLAELKKLAGDLSVVVKEISSQERLLLHIAAVFTSNYTNLMYTFAADLVTAKGLSFDLLKPLVAETARKVLTNEPSRVQTGPAKRGDQAIIDRHMQLLADMPEFAEIYNLLAQRIKERFSR